MAVAVRGDIHDQADMEAGPAETNGLGVFRDFAAEVLVGGVIDIPDSIKGAGAYTATAALTEIRVDMRFTVFIIINRVAAAFFSTAAAATTDGLIDGRHSFIMLVHFTGTAAAAHTDVFAGSAKTSALMPFEMRKGNQDICIHNGPADERGLTVLTVGYRDFHIILTAQAVSNDNMAAGGNRVETVELCVGQMIHRILAAAGIKGVAVREEGNTAELLDQIGNGFDIVRTEIGAVTQLPEVHLDGDKLSAEIYFSYACGAAQVLQFGALRNAQTGSEIREEYFGLFHDFLLAIKIRMIKTSIPNRNPNS